MLRFSLGELQMLRLTFAALSLMAASWVIPSAANAAEYRLVTAAERQISIADRAQVRASGTPGYREGWFVVIGRDEMWEGEPVGYILLLQEADCAGRRLRARSFQMLRTNGELIINSDREGPWTHVAPESTGSAMLEFMCTDGDLPARFVNLGEGSLRGFVRLARTGPWPMSTEEAIRRLSP